MTTRIRPPTRWRMTGGPSTLTSPTQGVGVLVSMLDDALPVHQRAAARLLHAMSTREWSARWIGRDGAQATLRIDAAGAAWLVRLSADAGHRLRAVVAVPAADGAAANDDHA